jgi:putative transcriptional regulator
MITIRLPEIMRRRSISIRELSRVTGITYTTVRAVYHGQRRSIQLSVLDAICQALEVQPGDVIVYTPPDKRGQPALPAPEIEKEPSPTPSATASLRRSGHPGGSWNVWE